MTIIAAGVLFRTTDGRVLFLKRAGTGEWAFPGGGIEEGETPAQAAWRECCEEIDVQKAIDFDPGMLGEPIAVTDTPNGAGQFATYEHAVNEPFNCVLNSEHTEAAWALPEDAPQPLHPGVAHVLETARADSNVGQKQPAFDEAGEKKHIPTELDIARSIAKGELPSPQPLAKSALFALRITGTGAAYRAGIDEYVWRDPSICLNDEFLARCNGLPVVWEHPGKEKRQQLDGEEFAKRAVGTIIFPYIQGDEVWGIARIFDQGAIAGLSTGVLSTSPGVIFGARQNTKHILDSGEKVLEEESPRLLDHLAITLPKGDPSIGSGVWDKSGPPTGVRVDSMEVSEMVDEPNKPEDVKADNLGQTDPTLPAPAADAGAPPAAPAADPVQSVLDSVGALKGVIDGLCARMDAFEGKNAPAAPAATPAPELNQNPIAAAANPVEPSRVDAADEPNEEARADAMDMKALKEQLEKLQKQNESLARMVTPRAPADEAKMAEIQARADAVFATHGERAKPPMMGESELAYRLRLAKDLQKHSKQWGGMDLAVIAATPAFDNVETQVYADAVAAANDPSLLPEAGLVMRTEIDSYTGQRRIHYKGRDTFIKGMAPPTRRAVLKTTDAFK